MTGLLVYQFLNFSALVVIPSSSRTTCTPILAGHVPLTSTTFASAAVYLSMMALDKERIT